MVKCDFCRGSPRHAVPRFSALAPLPPGTADFRVHVGDIYRGAMLQDYIATFTMAARRGEASSALHFAEDSGACSAYAAWFAAGNQVRRVDKSLVVTVIRG